jgi:uncharacterized protein YidB (DUF937 family)
MDLIEMGTQMLCEKLGVNVDSQTMQSALTSLIGDGKGGLDLAGLASSMASNGELGTLLSSWLGDGANQSMSADAISDLFGQEKVTQFADKVGVSGQEAAGGLSDIIPQLMDQASSGGNLLDQFGGAEGLLGAAKSFLR